MTYTNADVGRTGKFIKEVSHYFEKNKRNYIFAKTGDPLRIITTVPKLIVGNLRTHVILGVTEDQIEMDPM